MNKIPYQIDHSVFKWYRCFRFAFVCIDSLWWFDFDTLKKVTKQITIQWNWLRIPDRYYYMRIDRQIDRQTDYISSIRNRKQQRVFQYCAIVSVYARFYMRNAKLNLFQPHFLENSLFYHQQQHQQRSISIVFAIEKYSDRKTTLTVWLIRFSLCLALCSYYTVIHFGRWCCVTSESFRIQYVFLRMERWSNNFSHKLKPI